MENIIIFTDKETGAQRRYIILPRSHKQEAGKNRIWIQVLFIPNLMFFLLNNGSFKTLKDYAKKMIFSQMNNFVYGKSFLA